MLVEFIDDDHSTILVKDIEFLPPVDSLINVIDEKIYKVKRIRIDYRESPTSIKIDLRYYGYY